MIGLVLSVLLVATLLATSLLQLPGGLRRQMGRLEREIAAVYNGESAIIAWMEQFPAGYFSASPWNLLLPEVVEEGDFPWTKVTAEAGTNHRVVARVGATFRSLGSDELREMEERLVANLNREILGRQNLKVKSGNRRFTGQGENMALDNSAGDVTLVFDGNVGSVNVRCDGEINVRGTARYDTLRLYAAGGVSLTGEVGVKHLEVFSGGEVRFSRAVAFSGVIISRGDISLRDKARMVYPAVAASLGGGVSLERSLELRNPQEELSGNLDSLRAVLCADSSRGKLRLASAGCVLPASVGGKMRAIEWSME